MNTQGARAGGFRRVFSGHPRGVYLIAVVEVWERFSFYGMRGLLVLFLVAPVMSGGFSWSAGEALRFYGAYIALAYAAPIVGGYIADHFTGPRRALMIGAVLMCIGHLMMAGPVFFPMLIETMTGEHVYDLLYKQSDLSLGHMVLGTADAALLADLVANSGGTVSAGVAELAYWSVSYSFLAATGLIILGTGFFKPNSYAALGRLYRDDDPQRENGVFIFQLSVNLGAIFSGLVAGTIGERFGWHLGFSVAGVGMLVGLIIFAALQNRYLGQIPHTPPARTYHGQTKKEPLSGLERQRLIAIAFLGIISALYWLAAEQYGGLMNIYAKESTDRIVAGFEVPATWFLSLNPFFIVALTPLAMIVWASLGRQINAPQKFAIGFIMTAIGFILMVLAFQEASAAPDGKSAALWLVGAYLFVTLGELCILSIGMNMVNTYAPLRMLSSVLAFWFLCTALGNYGSGLVGSLTETLPNDIIFSGIAAACLVAAVILLFSARWWSTMVREDEVRVR